MTAPSYSTNLSTFDLAEGNTWSEPTATGWTQLGTTITLGDTDDFVQGTACNSGQCKTGVGGLMYNFGTGITIPNPGAVLFWMKYDAAGGLDNETNGGLRTLIGSALNAFYWVSQGGSDTYPYGGWINCAMADPSVITVNTVGSPSSTRQYAGWCYNAPTSVPSKGNPYKCDAARYGRCDIVAINGDGTNGYATFTGMAAKNDANNATDGYNRWGIFQSTGGSNFLFKGLMSLGTSGTAVDFRDSNKNILIDNTKHVVAGFNAIEVNNATSNVSWTNIQISALGTVSKGTFSMVSGATVTKDGCAFTDMSTFAYQSSLSSTGTTWRRCGQISVGTGNAPTMLSSLITGSTVAADSSALLWNCTQGPNGKLDGSTFVKGTNAHHAIEFGTNSPTTMTLTNVTFTGFNAANSQNDSAIYIKRTTGTVTIYIVGGTVPSYKSDGAIVDIQSNPVNVNLYSKKADGTALGSCQVLVKATAGGPFPVDATVTISNSGTTATVTHTTHGMATNDKVMIKGASLQANNGVFTITKLTDNSYSYTMASSPGSSPTGTIKATFVVLEGTTDGTGFITMSRVFSSAQPCDGWARKSTSAPYYKPGPISGSISSSTGATFTAVLILDQ